MTGPVKPWVWSGHRQPKLLCEALRFTGTQAWLAWPAWPAWLRDPISPQRSPLGCECWKSRRRENSSTRLPVYNDCHNGIRLSEIPSTCSSSPKLCNAGLGLNWKLDHFLEHIWKQIPSRFLNYVAHWSQGIFGSSKSCGLMHRGIDDY